MVGLNVIKADRLQPKLVSWEKQWWGLQKEPDLTRSQQLSRSLCKAEYLGACCLLINSSNNKDPLKKYGEKKKSTRQPTIKPHFTTYTFMKREWVTASKLRWKWPAFDDTADEHTPGFNCNNPKF